MDRDVLGDIPVGDNTQIPKVSVPNVPNLDSANNNSELADNSLGTSKSDLSPTVVPTESGGFQPRVLPSELVYESCKGMHENLATQLWGLHIRSGQLTYIVGETSAGKTVFLHNLAYHLASGKDFLGSAPPRPLKVLYVDFESNDEILAEHLAIIGTSINWHFFNPAGLIPGAPLMNVLKETIMQGQYDVVIIDPLMEAVPVLSENDNAEAARQMLHFRELARYTRAGIVAVHNSGHSKKPGEGNPKFLGRGATARQDKADIGINYMLSAEEGQRWLWVVKSRGKNIGDRIKLKFADDLGYEVLETNAPTSTQIEGLCGEVLAFIQAETGANRPAVLTSTLMTHFQAQRDSPKSKAVKRALSRNVSAGWLVHAKRGSYALADGQGGSPLAIDGASSVPALSHTIPPAYCTPVQPQSQPAVAGVDSPHQPSTVAPQCIAPLAIFDSTPIGHLVQ